MYGVADFLLSKRRTPPSRGTISTATVMEMQFANYSRVINGWAMAHSAHPAKPALVTDQFSFTPTGPTCIINISIDLCFPAGVWLA